MTIAKAHHYAIDAASLLETCISRLKETIALDKRNRHQSLVEMETVLLATERLLLAYICQQIDLEREAASNVMQLEENDSNHEVPPTLLEAIIIFQSVLNAKKRRQELQLRHARHNKNGHMSLSYNGKKQQTQSNLSLKQRPVFDHTRSPIDSLLFRLIVTLQLCLVRIDDAYFIITGHRNRDEEKSIAESSRMAVGLANTACALGVGCSVWHLGSSRGRNKSTTTMEPRGILTLFGKVALVALTGKVLVREWGTLWMTTKIRKSTADVQEWQQQWMLIQTTGTRRGSLNSPDAKSQRLIEYAMSQSPKVSNT